MMSFISASCRSETLRTNDENENLYSPQYSPYWNSEVSEFSSLIHLSAARVMGEMDAVWQNHFVLFYLALTNYSAISKYGRRL